MKKFEVLFNACHGGFSLSKEAVDELNHTYGWNINQYTFKDNGNRHEFRLIKLFKEKGSQWFSGDCANIELLECEADGYKITDFDGLETVHESYADFVIV